MDINDNIEKKNGYDSYRHTSKVFSVFCWLMVISETIWQRIGKMNRYEPN